MIWGAGTLFNFGLTMWHLSTPGEWDRVRDELHEEIPESQNVSEAWLATAFQACLFLIACLWPVWVVEWLWESVTR